MTYFIESFLIRIFHIGNFLIKSFVIKSFVMKNNNDFFYNVFIENMISDINHEISNFETDFQATYCFENHKRIYNTFLWIYDQIKRTMLILNKYIFINILMRDIMLYPLNQLKSNYNISHFNRYNNIYKLILNKIANNFIIYRAIKTKLPDEISLLIIKLQL